MKLSCLIVSSIIKKLPLAIQHNIQIQENGLTKLQGISEKDIITLKAGSASFSPGLSEISIAHYIQETER